MLSRYRRHRCFGYKIVLTKWRLMKKKKKKKEMTTILKCHRHGVKIEPIVLGYTGHKNRMKNIRMQR